jgi:hypothetical protein
VANSYFRDCGNEDWGSTAIAAGFPRGLTIEHNEIVDMPYSGISVGWGWTTLENAMRDNKILFNRIHDYMTRMGDGGGIYVLSNQTPSEIRGNYVFDLRRSPDGDPSSMIYLDEGSSGFLREGQPDGNQRVLQESERRGEPLGEHRHGGSSEAEGGTG